jgi:hypothetical protein
MAANFSAEYVVDGPLTKDEAEAELALYDPYVNSNHHREVVSTNGCLLDQSHFLST